MGNLITSPTPCTRPRPSTHQESMLYQWGWEIIWTWKRSARWLLNLNLITCYLLRTMLPYRIKLRRSCSNSTRCNVQVNNIDVWHTWGWGSKIPLIFKLSKFSNRSCTSQVWTDTIQCWAKVMQNSRRRPNFDNHDNDRVLRRKPQEENLRRFWNQTGFPLKFTQIPNNLYHNIDRSPTILFCKWALNSGDL